MQYLICHGTLGSPDGNWFPWLAKQLRAKEHQVFCPQLPTPHNQNPTAWLGVVYRCGINFAQPYTLIGHSCGASFLLHLLAASQNPAQRSIFVSPVMGDIALAEYNQLNQSFYPTNLAWDKIKSQAGAVVILHGDNDPYVPQNHAEVLHNKLGGTLKIILNGRHLNAESGFTNFPLLLDLLHA